MLNQQFIGIALFAIAISSLSAGAAENKNYGDSPACAAVKLSLAKELASKKLWFRLGQYKISKEYNPYPGSYDFSIVLIPHPREPEGARFSDQDRQKANGFMKHQNMLRWSKKLIRNCGNISIVSFPMPQTGWYPMYYRFENNTVKIFECLGYTGPSGWGFGPCS